MLNSEGYGLPDVDVCTNRFEGRNICLGPRVVEEPLLAYNDVQDGSDGILVKVQEAGEEAGKLPGDDTPSQNPAKYRRHRPQSADFQGFVRAVLSRGIDRQWIVTECHSKYRPRIDRQRFPQFAGLLSSTRSPRSVRSVR